MVLFPQMLPIRVCGVPWYPKCRSVAWYICRDVDPVLHGVFHQSRFRGRDSGVSLHGGTVSLSEGVV